MSSPMERTLKKLRAEGATAMKVERWNPWSHRRQDLWGFDVLALIPGRLGVTGIQVKSGKRKKDRDTLLNLPEVRMWVQLGNRAEVWSWSKRGPRGKRKLWMCDIETIL